MSRRVSSRDDLFLSAVDMYMLLSLAFIGFAFFLAPVSDTEALYLPIAQGGEPSQGPVRLEVRWDPGSTPTNPKAVSARCQLQVVAHPSGMKKPRSTYETACLPKAFKGTVSVTTDLEQLRAALPEIPKRPEVVILCDPSAGLFACASLQWVMHEAGFRPLAGVLPEP